MDYRTTMSDNSESEETSTGLPAFASGAEAQQQVDDDMAALKQRVEAIRDQQRQAFSATAGATSRDGRVHVTVDATGVPRDMSFARNSFEGTTPEKLARTVLATVQQAATSARSTLAGSVDQLRAGDEEMSAARAGAQEMLGDLGAPAVPHTASDPTGGRDPWEEGRSENPDAPDESDPDAPMDEQLARLIETPSQGAE